MAEQRSCGTVSRSTEALHSRTDEHEYPAGFGAGRHAEWFGGFSNSGDLGAERQWWLCNGISNPMTPSLYMTLELPGDLRGIPRCESVPEYEDEFDNVLSILTDLCEQLSKVDGVRFLISGFGQDDWNASVNRELCLLLEQLPAVAQEIVSGSTEFTIEFVEQGFWRTLSFSGAGDELAVSCASGDPWTPDPEVVGISRRDLADMLSVLVERFYGAANVACPELVAHPWFSEWRSSVSVLAGAPPD